MKEPTLTFTESDGTIHICEKKGCHKFVPFKGGLLHENIRNAIKSVTGDPNIKSDSIIEPCPMSNMEVYIVTTENSYYFVKVHDKCVVEVVVDEKTNGGFAVGKRLVAQHEDGVTFFFCKDKETGKKDDAYFFIAW